MNIKEIRKQVIDLFDKLVPKLSQEDYQELTAELEEDFRARNEAVTEELEG